MSLIISSLNYICLRGIHWLLLTYILRLTDRLIHWLTNRLTWLAYARSTWMSWASCNCSYWFIQLIWHPWRCKFLCLIVKRCSQLLNCWCDLRLFAWSWICCIRINRLQYFMTFIESHRFWRLIIHYLN